MVRRVEGGTVQKHFDEGEGLITNTMRRKRAHKKLSKEETEIIKLD